MDARSVAFMGSRLFSVLAFLLGIHRTPGIIDIISVQQMPGAESSVVDFIRPTAYYVGIAVFFVAAYVLWVHAGWMSHMLVDKKADPLEPAGSWSSLVYKGIAFYILFDFIPSAVSTYSYLQETGANLAWRIQLVTYLVLIAVAIVVLVGPDRFRAFIAAAGPGPSEPDER